MYHLNLPLQRQEHQQHQEKTTYEYYCNQKEALFERKVDLITSGLQPRFSKYLRDSSLVSKGNAVVICDYVLAMNTEINPSNNYRQTTTAGSKNKISYQIKTGSTQEEIVKECEQTKYDLVVMATSHLDSWMRSLFSETRKTISNINIPVLIVQ